LEEGGRGGSEGGRGGGRGGQRGGRGVKELALMGVDLLRVGQGEGREGGREVLEHVSSSSSSFSSFLIVVVFFCGRVAHQRPR